jgi:hypothetical protein
MRSGIGLLAGWFLAALLLLAHDGRLPEYLAGAGSGSVVVFGVAALVRWHRRPSLYCRPSLPPLPARYRAADDVTRPLAEVVAVAEREASAGWQ